MAAAAVVAYCEQVDGIAGPVERIDSEQHAGLVQLWFATAVGRTAVA